jgi:hypothetical protein
MWPILIGRIGIDYTMTTYMPGQVYIGLGTVYNCWGMSIYNGSGVILWIYDNYRRKGFMMVNGTQVPYFIIWNGI